MQDQPIERPATGMNVCASRSVTIQPIDRGFVVHVGCKAFAFIDQPEMMAMVSDFIKDQAGVEEKYYKGELFPKQ